MANETAEPQTNAPPRPREQKWAILAAALFAVAALGAAYYAFFVPTQLDIPDRELSDVEINDLLRLTRLPYLTEPSAEEIVTHFGRGAIPFLSATLRAKNTPPLVQGNICYILGMFRDPEMTPFMIRSLENNLVPNLTPGHRAAIVSTMNGLAHGKDEKALAFLEKLAGEPYWRQLPVTLSRVEDSQGDSKSQSSERMIRLFRDRALRSLGVAPDGAGAAALKRFAGKLPPELEEVRANALSESRRRKWRLNELSGVAP